MELKWLGVEKEVFSGDTLSYINLESGAYEGVMPVYCKVFPIFDDAVKVKVELQKVRATTLPEEEMQIAQSYSFHTDFEVEAVPLRSRDEALLSVRIVPFRQKGEGYEKLVSATLSVTMTPDFEAQKSSPRYANRSAMASGDWYKIGLPETGVYKLTYSDLTELGINLANIDPRQIRIYHNGGGVLPGKLA